MEAKPKDVNHDEKEVDVSVPSTAAGSASIEAKSSIADTSGVGTDGTVHSPKSSCKSDDNVAFTSVQEEDTEVVNVQEEVVLPRDDDNFEAAKDHIEPCESSSSEMSLVTASEGQINTEVTTPSYQAVHVEGSAPDDVPEDEDDDIDHANNSDWECSSPPRDRGVQVFSPTSEIESPELDVDNVESQSNIKGQTDAQQVPSSSDVSLQSCETASEEVVDVPASLDWDDEPTPEDGTSQEDISDAKFNEKELSQRELPEPGESNSALDVGPVKNDPVCAGGPLDSLSGGKSLMSEGGNIAEVNAGMKYS